MFIDMLITVKKTDALVWEISKGHRHAHTHTLLYRYKEQSPDQRRINTLTYVLTKDKVQRSVGLKKTNTPADAYINKK